MPREEVSTLDQATAGNTENLPLLGYRNYWYPIVEARRVKRKAVSIRIIGEDIVLFPGKDGKVAALTDRCPHRGVKLCRGRVLFPGTISCGYHGWTFDERGECVAALVEGPESHVPGKVKVKAYPTEIRHGIVWAFLGEGKPPPIEEDLPQELSTPGRSFQFLFEEWPCDWRNVTENYPDMLHALFVHRNSFEMIFQKIPAWGRMIVKPLADGKGLFVQGPGAAMQADYPGLGRYPRKAWWRVLSRRTPAGVGAELLEEVLHEQRDVLSPLAERRQLHRDHVQAVEQVFSEPPCRDFILKVHVCRRDNPHVDSNRLRRPNRLKALIFERPQNLGLSLQRHVADFIQKKGSSVGELKFPLL